MTFKKFESLIYWHCMHSSHVSRIFIVFKFIFIIIKQKYLHHIPFDKGQWA